jgi:hypothetical protein
MIPQQPNHAPAPANLPPAPGNEALPPVNSPWETEASDMVQFGQLMGDLQRYTSERNNHDSAKGAMMVHLWDHRDQSLKAEEQRISQSMKEVFKRGDTSVLLNELSIEANNANSLDGVVQDMQDKAAVKAADSRQDANVSGAFYYMNARRRPGGGTAVEHMSNEYGKANLVADKHARAHESIAKTGRERQGYSDALDQFVQNISSEARTNVATAEVILLDVTDKLNNWPLDELRSPVEEDAIRKQLSDLSDHVKNNFGASDSARGLIVGQATRLRYRLEHRAVTSEIFTGPNGHTAQFRSDRGIAINGGRTIIYEDGAQAEPVSGGGTICRRPLGNTILPPQVTLAVEAPKQPPTDNRGNTIRANDAFNHWEQVRSPEATVLAHSALSYEVEQGERYDQTYSDTIEGFNQTITNAGQQIHDIQMTAASEGNRALTTEETNLVSQAQAAIQHAHHELPVQQARQAQLRVQLNAHKYRKNFLEVGQHRTSGQDVAARSILRFTTRRQPDALPAAPVIRRNGAIEVEKQIINGQRHDFAVLFPKGITGIPNGRGGFVHYKADGSIY